MTNAPDVGLTVDLVACCREMVPVLGESDPARIGRMERSRFSGEQIIGVLKEQG